MKIKLSHFTPRKTRGAIITPNVICHSRNDLNTIRCYTCDEKGHISKFHPNKIKLRKNNKRIHHTHAAENDEPSTKRIRQESDDSSSEDEYALISTLTRTVSHGSNDWIIDSGASKHMTGFKESFVKLGDDYQYPIKGSGESSYKLDSGKSMKMKNVLFLPRLKKNLLSIHYYISTKNPTAVLSYFRHFPVDV